MATQKVLEAAFSKELKDYSWELIDKSTNNEYLLENISPITYMKIIGWNMQDKSRPSKVVLENVTVKDLGIIRVMTYMHQDEQAWDSLTSPLVKTLSYYVRKMLGYSSPGIAAFAGADIEAAMGKFYIPPNSIKNWYLEYFPPGSVNVGVSINFQMEYHFMIYDKTKETSDKETESTNIQYKRRRDEATKISVPSTALYFGCISGQKELEWKLVQLDIQFEALKK